MVEIAYHKIIEFAREFNGYEVFGFDKCGKLANDRSGKTLEELRAMLFFETRRYNHYGYNPDGKDLEYLIDLYVKIKALLAQKNKK